MQNKLFINYETLKELAKKGLIQEDKINQIYNYIYQLNTKKTQKETNKKTDDIEIKSRYINKLIIITILLLFLIYPAVYLISIIISINLFTATKAENSILYITLFAIFLYIITIVFAIYKYYIYKKSTKEQLIQLKTTQKQRLSLNKLLIYFAITIFILSTLIPIISYKIQFSSGYFALVSLIYIIILHTMFLKYKAQKNIADIFYILNTFTILIFLLDSISFITKHISLNLDFNLIISVSSIISAILIIYRFLKDNNPILINILYIFLWLSAINLILYINNVHLQDLIQIKDSIFIQISIISFIFIILNLYITKKIKKDNYANLININIINFIILSRILTLFKPFDISITLPVYIFLTYLIIEYLTEKHEKKTLIFSENIISTIYAIIIIISVIYNKTILSIPIIISSLLILIINYYITSKSQIKENLTYSFFIYSFILFFTNIYYFLINKNIYNLEVQDSLKLIIISTLLVFIIIKNNKIANLIDLARINLVLNSLTIIISFFKGNSL